MEGKSSTQREHFLKIYIPFKNVPPRMSDSEFQFFKSPNHRKL